MDLSYTSNPLKLKVSSNAIPRYQSQLSAMLQEHVACSLLGVDSDPVIGDDCAGNTQGYDNFNSQVLLERIQDRPCGGVNFEFLCRIFENCSKGSSLWHAQYLLLGHAHSNAFIYLDEIFNDKRSHYKLQDVDPS